MNQTTAPRKERNVGLDLLRISLALLIFMFHSNMHFDCHYGVFDHFARYGAIAMTGFFMLSGYALSLSSKVILTDIGSLKNFLLKRFISIYPLYYFVALVFIILLGSESFQSLALLFPFEALGLQSCFTSLSKISHNGGTWFISCLTICYLLYPLLQWIIIRLKVKEKVILGGVFLFLLFLAPLVQRHFNVASIYDNPFFRAMEFSLGIIAASVNNDMLKNNISYILRSKEILVMVIFFLILGISVADFYLTGFRDFMLMNWMALPCFIMIFLILGNVRFDTVGENRLVSYSSALSYAFFLSQFFVWSISYHIINNWIGIDNNIMRIIVSFTICVGISVTLHECVEKPSSKYLKAQLLN